jgi:photosystem II stability/assembly factor-like uncharacterized protein
VNPKKFYAYYPETGQLYISSDGGSSFSLQCKKLPGKNRSKMRPAPCAEGDLWLAAENAGVFRSTDSGATFSKVGSAENALAVGFGKEAPGKTYPAVYIVGTIGGLDGAFRSDDTGATWVRITDDQHQFGPIDRGIIGDPRVYGRAYLMTNGRGIPYGEPAKAEKKQ